MAKAPTDCTVFGHFGYYGSLNSAGDADFTIDLPQFRNRAFLGHIHRFTQGTIRTNAGVETVTLLGTPYSTNYTEYKKDNYYAILESSGVTFKPIEYGPRYMVMDLESIEDNLDFVNSKGNFSVFEYIDQTNFLKWSLISNIYNYNFSAKASNDDLFVESNNLVQKVNLLTEYKNVNYLLKIENNESQVDLEDIVKKSKSIPQVITLYDINKDLKNKENLIFL